MESKGKVISIARDMDGGVLLTTSLSGVNWHELESIDKNTDYRIKIEKWRNKRSLDANSYFHVLVGKIADAVGTSKPYTKNLLIHRYGQRETMEDGTPAMVKTNIPENVVLEWEENHWFPCRHDGDTTFYWVYRPTHLYNTREMSILIDGAISEAKNIGGIEVLPPHELEKMKGEWK